MSGAPGWLSPRSVRVLTLDAGSGHDRTVRDMEPRVGLCADRAEPAWDSLSAPSQLAHARVCVLARARSLSQNK